MKTLLIITAIAIASIEILILIRLRYDNLVKRIWRACQRKSPNAIFTQEAIANLPEPVQRYFLHAIALGTPLSDCVKLEMKGNFRLKANADWLPMKASEIISTIPGFVWRATVGRGLTKLSGADYLADGRGRMRFSLWGLLPLVDAQNPDINRSGIGRLAGEYSLWLPSALLPQNGVSWQAVAENTIQAQLKLNNEPITLTLTIDADGRILKMSLLRWGEQDGNWQYIPFGGEVRAEQTFDGYTIPSTINAGWGFDSDRYFEFFQTKIEQAQFC